MLRGGRGEWVSRVIVGDNSLKTLIVCSANLLPFLLQGTTSTAAVKRESQTHNCRLQWAY